MSFRSLVKLVKQQAECDLTAAVRKAPSRKACSNTNIYIKNSSILTFVDGVQVTCPLYAAAQPRQPRPQKLRRQRRPRPSGRPRSTRPAISGGQAARGPRSRRHPRAPTSDRRPGPAHSCRATCATRERLPRPERGAATTPAMSQRRPGARGLAGERCALRQDLGFLESVAAVGSEGEKSMAQECGQHVHV